MEWRGSNPNVAEVVYPTLADRLAAITRQVDQLIGADKMEPPRRAVRELIASGALERALKAGDKAPAFTLPDARGRDFALAERLAHGPVALVFYRGRWCPYCIAQLEELEKVRPEFEKLGATVCALSPQKPQHTGFIAEQHHLRYPVLSDAGNAVARQFGVAWKLPDDLIAHYRGVFVNLEHANATKDWELPIPSAFVIAPDSTVVWAQVDPDFTHRAEPQELLRVVRVLKGF
jgi:peroxiredoxin